MAKRRMFSSEIIMSDSFTQMGLGSQALYFHLGMNADDDGVVNNYKMIQRSIGANDDDLRVLVAKRFIIPIEEAGIIVIKHWKLNNYIQKDRYTPSKYRKDLELLQLDENGCYTENQLKLFDINEGPIKKPCIQNGYTDKNRLDKTSGGKNSIDKLSEENKEVTTNPTGAEEEVEVNDDDLPF